MEKVIIWTNGRDNNSKEEKIRKEIIMRIWQNILLAVLAAWLNKATLKELKNWDNSHGDKGFAILSITAGITYILLLTLCAYLAWQIIGLL